jgi:hypothetical protein
MFSYLIKRQRKRADEKKKEEEMLKGTVYSLKNIFVFGKIVTKSMRKLLQSYRKWKSITLCFISQLPNLKLSTKLMAARQILPI